MVVLITIAPCRDDQTEHVGAGKIDPNDSPGCIPRHGAAVVLLCTIGPHLKDRAPISADFIIDADGGVEPAAGGSQCVAHIRRGMHAEALIEGFSIQRQCASVAATPSPIAPILFNWPQATGRCGPAQIAHESRGDLRRCNRRHSSEQDETPD
jgi:hypothetical protein